MSQATDSVVHTARQLSWVCIAAIVLAVVLTPVVGAPGLLVVAALGFVGLLITRYLIGRYE